MIFYMICGVPNLPNDVLLSKQFKLAKLLIRFEIHRTRDLIQIIVDGITRTQMEVLQHCAMVCV